MSHSRSFLEQIMADAMTARTDLPTTELSVEARTALTEEIYQGYVEDDKDEPSVGDLVVFKDYMSNYHKPNAASPGVLHEVFPPIRGHVIGETNSVYCMETYDCTVAILHEAGGSATLVFTPANTRRLKKYDPTK